MRHNLRTLLLDLHYKGSLLTSAVLKHCGLTAFPITRGF